MKNKKTLAGAFTAAVGTGIGIVVTPDVVMWTGIVLGIGLAGTFVGWGHTEYVKRVRIVPPVGLKDPHTGKPISQRRYWNTEEGKRRIYHVAISRTLGWMLFSGLMLVPFTTTETTHDRRVLIAVGALWIVWSVLIAGGNPWTYRWTIKHVFPRLPQFLPGEKPSNFPDDDTTIITRGDGHD